MNDSTTVEYHYGMMLPNSFTEREAFTVLSNFVPSEMRTSYERGDLDLWEYMQEKLPVSIKSAGVHMGHQYWFVYVTESSMFSLYELTAVPDFKQWDAKIPEWDGMIRDFCIKSGIDVYTPKSGEELIDPKLQGMRPELENYPRWLCALQIGY